MMLVFVSGNDGTVRSAQNTETPQIAPELLFSVDHGVKPTNEIIENGATIYTTSGFYDYYITPSDKSQVTAQTFSMNGDVIALVSENATRWEARAFGLTTDLAYVSTDMSFGSERHLIGFYVGNPTPKQSELITTVEDGQIVRNGDVLGVGMSLAEDRSPATLTAVVIGIYQYTDGNVEYGKALSSAQYPDDAQAGVATREWTVNQYGRFLIRQVNHYSDDSQQIVGDTIVENPQPTETPFDTQASAYPSVMFQDGQTIVNYWVDHVHTVTRVWLDVDGEQTELPVAGGSGAYTLTGLELGTHNVQVCASFSDTAPAVSSCAPFTVTVNPVPVQTLLDSAVGDPSNANWQAVIDAPNATQNQKAIAQDALSLNQEIAQAQATNDPRAPQMVADRSTWLTETSASISFEQWLTAQQDWSSAVEVAQAREFITGGPTSSLAALKIHLQQYVPYGSLEYFVQTGSVYILNQGIASGLSESQVLGYWSRYAENIGKGPQLFTFRDWLIGVRN